MIRLQLLGTAELRDGEHRDVAVVVRRPKLMALLSYLAARRPRGFQRRDALLALFWPELDQAHARNSLRQAVHSLRRVLGRDALVARGEDELGVDETRLSSDVAEFEKCLEAGDLQSALSLYRGDLLTAFHLSDAPQFERWLELERDRIRRQAVTAALALAQKEEAAGEGAHAARWTRRALEISPYDEGALRRLLRLLDASGDRAAAIQHYDDFARRLAADLELDPAPETSALAAAIRTRTEPLGILSDERKTAAGDAATVGASQRERSPSARRGWRLAPAALAIAVVGALAVEARESSSSLDSNLLAIAPFEVFDASLQLWREGLVDVLSRSLDGAGPFRTVAPTVVIRRWEGHTDRESARALGHRTNARYVVFGQLLGAGPDSVRLTASVIDARSGRTQSEIDRTDRSARIDQLVDSVSVDVIRALMPTASAGHIRLYSLGTKSLPALKSFLQGEHYLRRFALDSAIERYDRAVLLDAQFPLALRRLQLAVGWNDSGTVDDLYARAATVQHALSRRDSLLVLSDSGAGGPGSSESHPAFHRIARRRLGVLEELARTYRDDPEVWYQLGEARFHVGFVGGASWNDARAAFDRAIELDSGFAPAYIHPVEIALNNNDSDAARRYLRAYLSLPSLSIRSSEGAAMRIVSGLLATENASTRRRELAAAPFNTLHPLGLLVRVWPDVNETQIDVWMRMLREARTRDSTVADWRTILAQLVVPNLLIHRGHLQEAQRLVGNRVGTAFMQLSSYGVIPPPMVERQLDHWLVDPGREQLLITSRLNDLPCSRTMDVALWWAARRDTAKLTRLLLRESSDTPIDAIPELYGAGRRRVPEFVRAALSLAQGDTALALRRFLAFPDSVCTHAPQPGEARFRLLVATGRSADAAALFDRSDMRSVPLVLERARLAESARDRETAERYYRFVVDAWVHADPELQQTVADARAAIARLAQR